jgi:hypothetical protein
MNDPIIHPSKNWKAWHDFMPSSKPTLHITGTVVFPTTGYNARLRPAISQGINPAIYLMDLVVTPPAEGTVVHQTVTDVDISPYREDTSNRYTHVTVLPEGVQIEVGITS